MSGCCPCFEGLNSGPPWNSFADCPEVPGRKPVICVAGLGSGTLVGRIYDWRDFVEKAPPTALEKLQKAPHFKEFLKGWKPQKKFSVTYCSIDALAKRAPLTLHGLWLVLAKDRLSNGTEVPCTRSCPGIDVQPVQGMAGIRTLNPGEPIPIPVWKGLSDSIQDAFNLRAFNYDWRRWGDEVYAEELVRNFRRTVEKHVKTSRLKAALVGHSMGSPVILYCVSQLGRAWTQEHVDNIVLVAPAHMGSPCMIPSLAHGPVRATHSFIPAPQLLTHDIADLCASWACMAAEMPVPVGGIAPWPADYPLIFTPSGRYMLKDMGMFLRVLSQHKRARDVPAALWPGIERLYGAIKPPCVPTAIVYSDAFKTIAQVEYARDDLSQRPIVRSSEPGDGTIVASSVEAVAKAWSAAGADVRLFKVPGSVSHKDLIACRHTADLLRKILTGVA